MSSRMLGATLITVAAGAKATPVFAQQPAAGPAPPEANGPGAPPQDAPLPGPPPQATPGGPTRSAIVTANVNLRGGPGTDAEVITTIPAGSRVRVTDCSGEWCMVTWNGRSGFAIARNLDIGGAHARSYRAPPGYAGGPPSGYPDGPSAVYEAGPPVIYGPPAYYPPPVVVYGPRYYYGTRYYGWRRRW